MFMVVGGVVLIFVVMSLVCMFVFGDLIIFWSVVVESLFNLVYVNMMLVVCLDDIDMNRVIILM